MRPSALPTSTRAASGAVLALALWSALLAAPARSQAPAQEPASTPPDTPAEALPVAEPGAGVTGADVLAQIDLVRLEVEQLRLALDRPPLLAPPVELRGVTLRECTHHARFLHRRAANLALELRRMRPPALPAPRGEADHGQLWSFVDATLDRLADARAALGLTAPMGPLPPAREVGADELLAALIEAERALEALAPEPPTYGELHFAVTRALGYASSLRATFPGRRMPPTPSLEPVSSNATIQDALRRCLQSIEHLTAASGLAPLAFVPEVRREGPTTGDLRALAELIEAELGCLHARHGDPDLLPPIYEPGLKSCPAVQQRCGVLAAQLHALQKHLTSFPALWSSPRAKRRPQE